LLPSISFPAILRMCLYSAADKSKKLKKIP
jgi:hypothetical protein